MKLFDRLYEGGKEVIKKMQKPLAEKKLKRRFESFIDGCDDRINEIDLELHNMQTNLDSLDNYDLNRVCKLELERKQAKENKKIIEKHYKEMFETDTPEEDDKE